MASPPGLPPPGVFVPPQPGQVGRAQPNDVAAAAASTPEATTPIGIKNGRVIARGVYGSAQLQRKDLAELQRLGIKTVISFCEPNEKGEAEERALLKQAGIALVSIPMPDDSVPSTSPSDPNGDVKRFLDTIGDPSRGPFLIHCEHGKGRTNVFGILARARELKQAGDPNPYEQAEKEARRFGFAGMFSGNQVKYARQAWEALAAGKVPGYPAP